MTHDSQNYHEPFAFKPERFLGENGAPVERDPLSIMFGFGRRQDIQLGSEKERLTDSCDRVCPGREVADNAVFIIIAMCAAVFNISKMKDESGQEIDPVCEYSSGIIR